MLIVSTNLRVYLCVYYYRYSRCSRYSFASRSCTIRGLQISNFEDVNMGENTEFSEVFNWWYFFGIVGALVAFPLMHILAGWYVFFLSN